MEYIDLSGELGNAFALMSLCKKHMRSKGLDPVPVIKEMMVSDYGNLIRVFEKHCGDKYELINKG